MLHNIEIQKRKYEKELQNKFKNKKQNNIKNKNEIITKRKTKTYNIYRQREIYLH